MTRFTVDWKTPHLWQRTAGDSALDAAPLTGETEAEICVIGGGLTGVSAALHAAEAGARVVLLEGGEIACAASGRNNGLVISHHSKAAPSEVEAAFGPEIGARYNALVAQSAGYAFSLMGRHGVDGHQVQNGWIQPAHTPETVARGRQFFEEWQARGADVTWLERDEISGIIGSPYLGGWRLAGSGHVNPYAMTRGLARAAIAAGATLHEGSEVTGIRRAGDGWDVVTARGRVRAKRVVVAANVVLRQFWPGLTRAMVPFRNFQVATAPLTAAQRETILRGNTAVSDMRNDLRYFHFDRDGRIATGALHTRWSDAKARGFEKVREMLALAFPALAADMPEMEDYWEGVFAVTPDRKPRIMKLAEGVMFGGLYSGRGVALSVSFGREMARWATGQIGEGDLPLPVTGLRTVPAHPVAVRIANTLHPWMRFLDRRDARRLGKPGD